MYILQPTLNYRNAVIPKHWMTYERSILLHTPPDSMGLEHSAFKGVKHSDGNLHLTKYETLSKNCNDARPGSWSRRVSLRESTRRVPVHILVAPATMTCGHFHGQRNSLPVTPSPLNPLAMLLLLNMVEVH